MVNLKWASIVDAKIDGDSLPNMPASPKSESKSEPLSFSDSQPVPANQLDQLIAALTAQTQTQTALIQALDYLIGQNQQLLELVIQQQEIDKDQPAPDSLD